MVLLFNEIKIASMAAAQAKSFLDPEWVAKAKSIDPNAQIRIYNIGREGWATPETAKFGAVRMFWSRDAVNNLYEAIPLGSPIYHSHEGFFAGEKREQYGFVVGKGMDYINDLANAYVAVFMFPKYSSVILDIASFEGVVDRVVDMESGDSYISSVDSVTGIALGNSAEFQPAFPSATIQTSIAAFKAELEPKTNPNPVPRKDTKKMDLEELTPGQIRSAIKKMGIPLDDLFASTELESTPIVQTIVARKLAEQKEVYAKEKAELESTAKGIQEKLGAYAKDASKFRASQILPKVAETRKLTEKQKQFIDSEMDGFVLADPEKAESELNTFIDAKLQQYDKFAKTFDLKDDSAKTPEGETKSDESTKSGNDIATPSKSNSDQDEWAKYLI